MSAATSISTIPFPPFLVKVDLPNDRALSIIVKSGAQIFEITWDVVLAFMASGDPFVPRSYTSPPLSTITEVGPTSPFLDNLRATYGDCAEPDYLLALSAGEAVGERMLRHWRIVSHDWGFDVAAIDPPAIRLSETDSGS